MAVVVESRALPTAHARPSAAIALAKVECQGTVIDCNDPFKSVRLLSTRVFALY